MMLHIGRILRILGECAYSLGLLAAFIVGVACAVYGVTEFVRRLTP